VHEQTLITKKEGTAVQKNKSAGEGVGKAEGCPAGRQDRPFVTCVRKTLERATCFKASEV